MSSRSILIASIWLGVGGAIGCKPDVVDLGNSGPPIYGGQIDEGSAADAGGGKGTVHILVDRISTPCAGFANVPLSMAVEHGQLYWLASSNTEGSVRIALNSCNIYNCGSSHASWPDVELTSSGCGNQAPMQSPLQLDGNSIYWQAQTDSSPGTFTTTKTPGIQPQQLRLPNGIVWPLMQDGTLYATSTDSKLLRCGVDNCLNTVEVFAMHPPGDAPAFSQATVAGIVAADASSLYVADPPWGHNGPSRLLKVDKDPDATFSVVVQGSSSDYFESLKILGDRIYWVENVMLGQLKTCPSSGCLGAPQVLVDRLIKPSEIAIDGSYVYILEPPQLVQVTFTTPEPTMQIRSPGRISRCPITGCEEPEVLFTGSNEYAMGNLFADERFVYFSAGLGPVGTHYIAAIEK